MRIAVLLEILVVTALPFVLAALLRRRWALSWALFGAGALTFVASQVVHIPLNLLLARLGIVGGGRSHLVANAIVLGLTPGLCEETARWLAFRYWRREARSGPQAMMFGVGHAGIEAILLVGVLSALALFQIALIDKLGVQNLGLPPDQAEALAGQVQSFDTAPLWGPALAVLERLCALAFHVAATLLVLGAVVRRRTALLFAAIAWHAFGDGAMMVVHGHFGPVVTEGFLVALVPVHFAIGRWAYRLLPAHTDVVPIRPRPKSSGDPIELVGVEKRFGKDVRALSGISFRLRPGERACLLGPNGAGKTTTIRMLTGALAPTDGHALLYGAAAGEAPFLAAKRRVGIVPQQPGMYKDISCREYLKLVADLYEVDDTADVVRRLELEEMLDRPMATLSGGWQRRLCLAAAILPRPDLLILDEPSAGLDPIASREVIDLLRDVTRDTTTLLCTHNLAEAEELCDSVIILRRGKVLVHESIDRLRDRTAARVALRVVGELDALAGALRERGYDPTEVEGALQVLLPEAEKAAPALLRDLLASGHDVCECHIVRPTLEDLFLQIIRNAPPSSRAGAEATP